MAAVPVADEEILVGVDVPLGPAQFAARRHGHTRPALQVSRRHDVGPALRIGFEGAWSDGDVCGANWRDNEGEHAQDQQRAPAYIFFTREGHDGYGI